MTKFAARAGVFFLLTYGFFYFVYRYLNPVGATDFPHYYAMYQHPFDTHVSTAPFIYRQWNAVITHLLWRAHLFYPDRITFQNLAYDQHIFFAALLSNYLGVIATALASASCVDEAVGSDSGWSGLLPGLLCCTSFWFLVSVLGAQADGWSWFFVALLYLFYLRKNRIAFALLAVLSLSQREILPLVFASIAACEWWRARNVRTDAARFFRFVVVTCVSAFAFYLLLRKILLPVDGYAWQISPRAQLHSLVTFRPHANFLFQVFLSQNLMFLFIAMAFRQRKAFGTLARMFWPICLTSLLLVVISVGSNISTNAGRMVALLVPIVSIELTMMLVRSERASPKMFAQVMSV